MKHREKFLLCILLWPLFFTSAHDLPVKQEEARCFGSNSHISWLSDTLKEYILKNTTKSCGNSIELFQSSDRVRERAKNLAIGIQGRLTNWRYRRISLLATDIQLKELDVRHSRITGEARRINRFHFHSKDIHPGASDARDRRLTRETTRVNLFPVRTAEIRLKTTDNRESRIMRETRRVIRFPVNSKNIQLMATESRDRSLKRKTTRVNRFFVPSHDIRLRATDNQENRMSRETRRVNRFSVRSKEIQHMITESEDSCLTRETTRGNRFSVRSVDIRLKSIDTQDSRKTRDTTRVIRFHVRSKEIQPTATESPDSRLTRETRGNRFSVRSVDIRLKSIATQDSRITRDTTRVIRFHVRTKDIQPTATESPDSRLTRETTRMNRFSVRSMDIRLNAIDTLDSRITRDTTRVNRFSVRSTGIQPMTTYASDSRLTRGTTRGNRFPVRSSDIQLMVKDIRDDRSRRESRRSTRFSEHLKDGQYLITDWKDDRMLKVNEFPVNLRNFQKYVSVRNRDEVRARKKSLKKSTMLSRSIQTMVFFWKGDESKKRREISRSGYRLLTHVTALQSGTTAWKDSGVCERRIDTRIASSFPFHIRDIQRRAITGKSNRVARLERRIGSHNNHVYYLRDLSRSAAAWKEDKSDFRMDTEQATDLSAKNTRSKDTSESKNNRHRRRQITLKETVLRKAVTQNYFSRTDTSAEVGQQNLDIMLLMQNKPGLYKQDARAVSRIDVSRVMRVGRFRLHEKRLKRELLRKTPKHKKICENADNRYKNKYSTSPLTSIKSNKPGKDNNEPPHFGNFGFEGKYNTDQMIRKTVSSEIQTQYRIDIIQRTDLLRLTHYRNRVNVKEKLNSILLSDIEIENQKAQSLDREAKRQTHSQNKRNKGHSKGKNELLRVGPFRKRNVEHSSVEDIRKHRNRRSLTRRTRQRQASDEDINRVSYSERLRLISGFIELVNREYAGTFRSKFGVGRFNRASSSDSFWNIRLMKKYPEMVGRNDSSKRRRSNAIGPVRNSEPRISSVSTPTQSPVDARIDSDVKNWRNVRIQDNRRRQLLSRIVEVRTNPEVLEFPKAADAKDFFYTWNARMTFWNSFRILLNVILGLGAILLACDVQDGKCAPSVFSNCWRLLASPSY